MKLPLVVRQGLRFGLVGLLNTALTFGIFVLFFRVFRTKEIIANVVGYIVGVINSFLWNKFWTFRSEDRDRRLVVREAILFLLIFLVSLGVQMLLFQFLLNRGFVAELAEGLSMILYTLVNFSGNKLLTFRKSKD